MMERRFYKTFNVRLARSDAIPTEGQASSVAPVLAGYASVFNSPSEDLGGFIEIVAPGAFARSLNDSENIFALWSHDTTQPLGSVRGGKLGLSEDSTGLAFTLDTSRFTRAQLDAAADNELKMSFGFQVVSEQWTELADGTIQRTLIEVDLFEVSPVIMPAYPDTSAALRSLEAWRLTASDTVTAPEIPVVDVEIEASEAAPLAVSADSAAVETNRRNKQTNHIDLRIARLEKQ